MIVLDEKEYAEECLNRGVVDKKPYATLMIIAKYYYHYLGYRKKKIQTCLTRFLEDYHPDYRLKKESWDRTIDRISTKVKKYPLYRNTGVRITKSELACIAKINNEKQERIAFTLLCIAKLNYLRNDVTNGWVNTPEKEIFEIAGVSCTSGERSDYIGDLYIAGIVEFAKKNTNLSMRITFMDHSDDEEAVFISDFRALGNEYAKLNGGNYIRCHCCGLLIKGNRNGTRKYCDNCRANPANKFKTIYCIDCGEKIVVSTKNNKTLRCQRCQEVKRATDKREWTRRKRIAKIK